MLLKLCKRCNTYIRYPATYCSKCQAVVDKQREESSLETKKKSNCKYNRTRNKKYIRFYNSPEWKRLSLQYMIDKSYHCEGDNCTSLATEVHHIVPIQTPEGWDRRFDYNNLRALCVKCHNKEHFRFMKRAGVDKKVS